jgi:flagellar basal body rod protein FlgC
MSDAAFDIAAEGMAAERSAMDAIAQRLATGSAATSAHDALGDAGSAYVPASFSSALNLALSPDDASDLPLTLDGGMEWASTSDAMDGGVDASVVQPQEATMAAPDADPIGQMIALVATGRAYDADVAALQAAKQMDVEASDIDKF